MSVSTELMSAARYCAKTAQGGAENLKSQLQELDRQRRELQEKLEVANRANQRLETYVPLMSIDYICPRCWVLEGRQTSLHTIPSGDTHKDTFRCASCHLDIDITV